MTSSWRALQPSTPVSNARQIICTGTPAKSLQSPATHVWNVYNHVPQWNAPLIPSAWVVRALHMLPVSSSNINTSAHIAKKPSRFGHTSTVNIPSHACSDRSYNPGTGSVSCGFSATGNRPQSWNFAPSPHTTLILPGRNSRPSFTLSCHTSDTLVQLTSPSHTCLDGSYNPDTGSVSCGFSVTGNRP
jgi:hypothetical protein